MRNRLLILISAGLLVLGTVQAQVTVGSDCEPHKGALLELRQNDNNGRQPNAEAGLGLPRVSLSSPDVLTIDVDSKKDDYVGISVYNTTSNSEIKEGVHVWNGRRWMMGVSVDSSGTAGQLLTSKGDGTFVWSDFTLPEYTFHKPTQIAVFDAGKAVERTYSYSQVAGTVSSGTYKPPASVFNGHYVYDEILNIQTEASNNKYILLGITGLVREITRNKKVPQKGFWQIVEIEVLIDDVPVNSCKRLYSTAANASVNLYIDMFTIVPLTGYGTGSYNMKIKIKNIENTFYKNRGNQDGYFNSAETNFYLVSVRDVNFVLYEDD